MTPPQNSRQNPCSWQKTPQSGPMIMAGDTQGAARQNCERSLVRHYRGVNPRRPRPWELLGQLWLLWPVGTGK